MAPILPLLLWLVLALLPGGAEADAIVRSQAMHASTIAEYAIEEGGVSLDLEIGPGDIEAFANLLPDELYERLGGDPKPWSERLATFFENDLRIAVGEGAPLIGQVVEMGARPRVRRDDITGEPLRVPEGEEPEMVLFARLHYPLPEEPESLTLFGARLPKTASVGFVAYHQGIPINDFRYLAASQTVSLDWGDPWYSHFGIRALRRQYDSPVSGFIYVEPYEVRKEIVARPRDLQHWVDLGLEGRATIPVEIQDRLKRRAAEFLRVHQIVEIDGQRIEPELARVNFLERTLRTSRVIDPPQELDVNAAVLGLIFVYPTDGLPERVTMDWDLWSDRIQRVPVASVDQAGPLPSYLEPDWRVLEWQNFLKNPELPTLRVLASPPGVAARLLWWGRWPVLLGALALLLRARSDPRRRAPAAALAAGATVLAFWIGQGAQMSEPRAREVVSGLLHNVYRAFDFREEEKIYDVLARSAEGDLLADIYLETRRGLELQSQGGARAKVKEIELVDLATESSEGGGFLARATWNVAGSVGHWGHLHQRRNRYRAELTIAPVGGEWKLVDLEILEEERL